MFRVVPLIVLGVHIAAGTQATLVGFLQNLQLPLTPKCDEQIGKFLDNFSLDPSSWALQMVDASSKVPSGLLDYNFGEMGDFQECINIEAEDILGKYCLGYIQFSSNFSLIRDGGSPLLSARQGGPTWALCLPSGCTTDDANAIGNGLFQGTIEGLEVGFSDFLCQTKVEAAPELTPAAITTIALLVLLGLTTLLCTCYDLYCVHIGSKSCPLLVRGFSVYTNGQKVFRMTTPQSDQLPCLNGLRLFSMMWVVAGHQFSIPTYGPLTNSKYLIEWTDRLYTMFLVSGTLSVDTFFTVGGALMSYSYMKAKKKGVPFNLVLYYLHRYLRLTAPFALVILVSATLLKYLGSGPKWPFLYLYFQKNCEDNWWSGLLYVQNYVNNNKMCLGQTWYLDIDMQLYILSPLVFTALWKYPRYCLPFLGLCSLASMALSFYEAWQNELTAILSNLYTTHNEEFQTTYYLLTHTRATTWIIGVVLGYYLFKIKQNEIVFKPQRAAAVALWGVCFGILLVCALVGHGTLRGPGYDRLGNALHIAFVRPSWSLAIAWIILACSTNCGGPVNWILSLPIFQVLNRFTYGIYLTHVTLLYVIIYGRQWPDYFSNFNMAYQFWGTWWFSTGLAAILVFTTESPMLVIEKILLGGFAKKPKPDVEKGVDNPGYER